MTEYSQYVIIGGTGQTGHRFLESVVGKARKVVATSRDVQHGLPAGPLAFTVQDFAKKWGPAILWKRVDLESELEVLKKQLEDLESDLDRSLPTVLVLAAAFTNVDGCETDPQKCQRINELNTISVMQWAKERFKAKVVFYSTDYVFDGKSGPYEETHPRHAICVYGNSKVRVEEWIEKHSPKDGLILRTTGVFDNLKGSKNFFVQMLECFQAEKTVRIPSDQYANPVWAKDLATATLKLIEKNEGGIFNVAGAEFFYRSDWARTIALEFGFPEELVQTITTGELNQKAARPLRAGLAMKKLQATLNWAPLGGTQVLRLFRKELEN